MEETGRWPRRVALVGLSFLDPSRLEQEIRLSPLEEGWHATQGGEARYAALAPGQYTFEARTHLPAQPWSEPALLRIAYAYERAVAPRKPPKTTPPLAAR